jgi:CRP/FNR family transcriptional regulator/CRP/FNR family cyclic AMP-dependent transcriptional regulator
MRGTTEHHDLTRIWLFSGCSKAELRKIQRLLEEVTVPSGTLLVQEGEEGYLFFVVVSGTAAVVRRRRTIATLGPGDFFGELSLIDRAPRSASVTCTTDMSMLVIRQRDFQTILKSSPRITRKLLASMSGRLRDDNALLYS